MANESPAEDSSDHTNQSPNALDFKIAVRTDRESLTLTVVDKEGDWKPIELTTASVDLLTASLGKARSSMIEPVVVDPAGSHSLVAVDPRWLICPDDQKRFAVIWLRHPGLGWMHFGFTRYEAGNIAKWLRKVTSVTSTQQTQSQQATSVGGGDFLLSSEGMGFYRYGKDENRIGANPFEQIEFDSDRAAAVVAAAILELRLEQAIKGRFEGKAAATEDRLFSFSGALGAFSAKASLAHAMGLLSDRAFKDVDNIRTIRNKFAHDLNIDHFDEQSVRDRCSNLSIIDDHVGPLSEANIFNAGKFYFSPPDVERKLTDPRFRYTMTAQTIASVLCEDADAETKASLPLI